MQKMSILVLVSLLSFSAMASTKVFKAKAVATIKPEHVADFRAAVKEILEPSRDEAGNISYECFQILNKDGSESNRFEFREVWVSERDLVDIHLNTEHMKKFMKKVGPYFQKDPEISGEYSLQL